MNILTAKNPPGTLPVFAENPAGKITVASISKVKFCLRESGVNRLIFFQNTACFEKNIAEAFAMKKSLSLHQQTKYKKWHKYL